MSALSTRDALAKALGQHCPIYDYESGQFLMVCGCEQWRLGGVNRTEAERRFGEHIADALIASGAVVDVATLADDEALMQRAADLVLQREGLTGLPQVAARYVRALAAALTERAS